MSKILLGFIVCFFCALSMAKECVVLLHGMARTDRSMDKMEIALKAEGYVVVNYGYPSTQFDIDTIAKEYLPQAVAQCEPKLIVNFVTHSLGGIVLRKYLAENTLNNMGRVVMLGPPNKGSEVVDTLKHVPGFKFVNGPAGMQLGTGVASVPNSLGALNYPVGIIAGSATINPILSQMLPNPDDGKVSVESTKLEGMKDHLVVPVSHPFLMRNKDVIRQVKAFLKTGLFLRR